MGVCATCASFTLLTPTLVEALNLRSSVILMTELYLLCPLVSVLSAAVANLALEETRGFASRAVNVGVRRFSKSGNVGRTWLSSSEQVQRNSRAKTERWWSFVGSVLPAPVVGSILGGPLFSTKCIVVAALAAAQSAYFLAQAESVVARATGEHKCRWKVILWIVVAHSNFQRFTERCRGLEGQECGSF